MKVIAEAVKYRAKCPHCLSIVEFDKSDIERYKEHNSNAQLLDETIACPVCNSVFTVRFEGKLVNYVEPIYKE